MACGSFTAMESQSIHLWIEEENLGPFTVEEVQDIIDDGRADASTPYWVEGMDDWESLSELEYSPFTLPIAPPASAEGLAATEEEIPTAPPIAAPAPPPVAPPLPTPTMPVAAPAPPLETITNQGHLRAMEMQRQAKRKSTGGTMALFGWVALVFAVIFVAFHGSPLFLLIGGVAALASLVLGIVACVFSRVGAGVTLIVMAVLLPIGTVAGLRHYNISPFGAYVQQRSSANESVDFLDANFTRASGQMTVSGRLRNKTDKPLKGLEVVVEWRDGAGTPIAENIDAIEPLAPGAEADFEIRVVDDERVVKYAPYVRFR